MDIRIGQVIPDTATEVGIITIFTVKETAKRGIAAGKRLLCSLQMIFSILFEVIQT